jgi:hypothetical protein
MSLLDKASLIVTANGYKASKLYSVVPSDGSGDMTVTRATTATRVNSSGLIESVANNVPRLDYLNSACPTLLLEPQRTNLQTYSEDFSNAVYIKVGATVRTNTDASPDGTTTADRLSEDSSTGIHTAAISAGQVTGGDYTFSVFVKANGRTKFQLAESFSIGGAVNFDLTAVTATTTAPAKNGKIENLIPKKEYFLDVLDSFSQEQKNAAYDTVKAISELPENANDDDIANMMQELSEIESQYGKELIKTIDSRLNELSDEINSKGQEQTKSIAV